MDPYHGQQDKRPEPEAMDLPEDLNLDQDEEAGDDGEGEGDGEACCYMNTHTRSSLVLLFCKRPF